MKPQVRTRAIRGISSLQLYTTMPVQQMRVVQYSDIMRFILLCDRHHKVSPNPNLNKIVTVLWHMKNGTLCDTLWCLLWSFVNLVMSECWTCMWGRLGASRTLNVSTTIRNEQPFYNVSLSRTATRTNIFLKLRTEKYGRLSRPIKARVPSERYNKRKY